MALHKITEIAGGGIFIPGDDIDTDRIIPARYMKSLTFDGLGQYAFNDERKDAAGRDRPHPMNEPRFAGARILVSGANFGCGSSREHAPQALYRWGIRAILAVSFAEIFFGNANQIGMPCLCLRRGDAGRLGGEVAAHPDLILKIDIKTLSVVYGDVSVAANLPAAVQRVLLDGRWDPIAELLEKPDQVGAVARRHAYMTS